MKKQTAAAHLQVGSWKSMCPPCVGGNCYPNRACTSHGTCPMDHRAKKCSCHLLTHTRPPRARGGGAPTHTKRHERQHPPNAETPAKKNTRAPSSHDRVRSYLFLRVTFTFPSSVFDKLTEGFGHLTFLHPQLSACFTLSLQFLLLCLTEGGGHRAFFVISYLRFCYSLFLSASLIHKSTEDHG